MKKTALIFASSAALIIFISIALLHGKKKELIVVPMEKQGIFIGERKQIEHLDHSKISPEAKKRMEDHQRDIKAIDDASEKIQSGDVFLKDSQYEKALGAYQEAYKMDPSSRTYIGVFMLIPTYEKLGRYDEALSLLEELEQKSFKGEYGTKKAQEIRTRLLAGKDAVRLKGTTNN